MLAENIDLTYTLKVLIRPPDHPVRDFKTGAYGMYETWPSRKGMIEYQAKLEEHRRILRELFHLNGVYLDTKISLDHQESG